MSTNPILIPDMSRPPRSGNGTAGRFGGAEAARVWDVGATARPPYLPWLPRPTVSASPLGLFTLGMMDLLAAGFAFVAAYVIAGAVQPGAIASASRTPPFDSAVLFLVFGTALAVVARVSQLFGSDAQQNTVEETYVIVKVVSVATGIGAASTVFYRDSYLSVLMLASFWALACVSIVSAHGIYHHVIGSIYGRDPRPRLRLSLVEPSSHNVVPPPGRAFVIGSHLAVLSVAEPQHHDWPYACWWQIKRDFDVVGASVLVVLTAPLMLAIALAIRATSPGPALFRQKRIGRNARPFAIYKFRTMRIDAEAVLAADPALYAAYVANDYKLPPESDPRITPLGRWLRRTSLDELPQLFNVLRGEMSLVGPRPIVANEIEHYGDRANMFHAALPGLTGAWQVAGRSDLRYPERCDVELDYVQNWSLGRDIMILFATVGQVLSGRGAM